jgi:hypothetical protein
LVEVKVPLYDGGIVNAPNAPGLTAKAEMLVTPAGTTQVCWPFPVITTQPLTADVVAVPVDEL